MKKIAISTALCLLMQTCYLLSACASYEDNLGTIDLTAMTVTGAGIAVTENTISITEGGDFTVTGENNNAMIYVNAQDKVKLRLSGVSLKNESGPAIFFDNAEKSLITVTENTENIVEDGSDYGDTDAKAAIFSNDDLEIKGNGSLTVVGNYKHGIASDDDISIENGVLNITANVTDGIHVNNTFKMSGGTLNISAVSDGIQAEEDVVIDGGVINITKSEEGIESGTTLTINGGEINIVSTDDGLNSGGGLGTGGFGAGGFGGMVGRGQQPDGAQPNGTPPELPNGEQQNGTPPEGTPPEGAVQDRKAMMPPDGGKTAGSGADTSNTEANSSVEATDRSIYINGGIIKIDASGDGVDSNDSIYMTGGELYVDGPTSGGDSAIDTEGRFEVSGGTVVAVGSSGMAMGVTSGSDQCAFLLNLSETAQAGSVVSLVGPDGNTVFEYTAKKAFSSVVYSSHKLKENETYTLYINGEEKQTVEMTQKQVTLGSRGAGGFGGPNGSGGGRFPGGANGADGTKGFGGKDGGVRPQNGWGGAQKPIQVVLNGAALTFDTSPTIENDTTLVPFRGIFEALGMEVTWDEATQTVSAWKDGVTLTLTIGSAEADKNGEKIGLLAAPVLSKEGRTLVPVRFIAESLGLTVTWDEATRTVNITA